MKQLHDVMEEILRYGDKQPNRTGVSAITIPGAMMKFDLNDGFPAVTTKKLAWKSVVAELCGFMRGVTSAKDFRELGTRIWDQNANENQAWLDNPFRAGEDDLGPVYGAQWRNWQAFTVVRDFEGEKIDLLKSKGWTYVGDHESFSKTKQVIFQKTIDQVAECFKKIVENPYDRRILFHGWNPAVLDQVALPSCHVLYQFLPSVKSKVLNMVMFQRSNDVFIGNPFNIASAALLLSLFSHMTGYTPGKLTIFMADAHIYENHLEQVEIQLAREEYPLPTLKISDRIPKFDPENPMALLPWLEQITPEDFELVNYQHHPAISAKMAV